MECRELFKFIVIVIGIVLFVGNVFVYIDVFVVLFSDILFNEKDVVLLNEMGEVIIF